MTDDDDDYHYDDRALNQILLKYINSAIFVISRINCSKTTETWQANSSKCNTPTALTICVTMATYSFPVPLAWSQYFSSSKLGRHLKRSWTKPNVFKCLLDYEDEAPLLNINIECLRWSETPLISKRSGIWYVAIVTKNVCSYCREPLVESNQGKSHISDTNWLTYPWLSYLIKIWLSVWRYHLVICIL